MRTRVLLAALLALFGCRVDVTGAACKADGDCPKAQHCGADSRCTDQAGPGPGSGSSSSGASSGSGSSGSSGSGSSSGTGSSASSSSGSSGVSCPAVGTQAGEGCATLGLTQCSGNAILTCSDVDAGAGSCPELVQTDACGDLECAASSGGAACACPDAGPDQRFVDGVDGTFLDGGPGPLPDGGHWASPSGAREPARCRYRTFTDALSGASHVTATTSIPLWQPGTSYQLGERVRPTSSNAKFYAAARAGVSGQAEPAWDADAGPLVDGAVTWAEAGGFVYPFEALPLRVQPSHQLDTTDCPSGTTSLCSPLLAVVVGTTPNTSPLLSLEAGGSVTGVALFQQAPGGSDGIACATPGPAALVDVWVLGFDRLTNCVAARSGCALQGGGLVTGQCKVGLLVSGGGDSRLSESVFGSSARLGGGLAELPNELGVRASASASGSLTLSACVVAGNDAGVEVTGPALLSGTTVAYNSTFGVYQRAGDLGVADGGLVGNGLSGLSLEGGTLAMGYELVAGNGGNGVNLGNTQAVTNATLTRSTIAGNGGTGLASQQGHEATLDLTFLDIYGNGSAASGQDQAGVLLDNAGTMLRFEGNAVHGNAGPQLRVTRQPASGDWDLAGFNCLGRANSVYCYSGSGDNTGISNEAGGTVSAPRYFWPDASPVAGNILGVGYHDYAGGVNINNSGGTPAVCGVIDGGSC